MQVPFKQVDVFTAVPYQGNPVAVVLDARSLTTGQMQAIASWTNLSETTFVLPPTTLEADYQLRIFTPRSELPFGGHPTLGSVHALLEADLCRLREGKLVQECGVGLVTLHVQQSGDRRTIYFDLPAPAHTRLPADAQAQVHAVLGLPQDANLSAGIVDVGPVFIVVQLPDAAQVLALTPDMPALAALSAQRGVLGIVAFGAYLGDGPATIESRAFFPAAGIPEDPVCGSGNGAIAAFIRHTGQTGAFGERYTSSQGSRIGRAGRLSLVFQADGGIQVGGQSVTCLDGQIRLPD